MWTNVRVDDEEEESELLHRAIEMVRSIRTKVGLLEKKSKKSCNCAVSISA